MAAQPSSDIFQPEDIKNLLRSGCLDSPNSLIIDDFTQTVFEPVNGEKFGQEDVGSQAEIGGTRFDIAGSYHLGTGLAANGSVIVSDRAISRLLRLNTQDACSLGLLSLDPQADVQAVASDLRNRLAVAGLDTTRPVQAVDLLTRQQALDAERYRWLWQTPIGLIFQMGVAISLFVGAAIVYMVLSTDVAERLPEYATLLAVGYSRFYLARCVMQQAILLALFGFLVAWLLAEALYRVASNFSGIPMAMTAERVAWVGLMGLAMCCFSGLLALRKLWKAEPANLF
jgi:putative ABC transport system permease protein